MLYLMRHGQTEWNRMRMLQGRSDIPLNETGRQMARDAAQRYREVNFDVCFCSPLQRARETAELFLAGRQVPILPDERLVEMCFGDYEGTSGFDREGHPLCGMFCHPETYRPVGGSESIESLYARSASFVREKALPLLREGKDVLVVAHGALCLGVTNQVRRVPLEKFWETLQRNCELQPLTDEEVEAAFGGPEG